MQRKTKKIISYIYERFSEPSTIVGFALFVSSIYHLPSITEELAFYIEMFVGFLGLISMLMPEGKEHRKKNTGKEI